MRLFVALDLPPDLELPDPPAPWRTVPREKRHITLVFLGSVSPTGLISTLKRHEPPQAPLTVSGFVTLPARRPRVLALALTDPTGRHSAHQRLLSEALDHAEDRPWLPHVTIGRTKERPPRTELAVEPLTFTPPSMTLYEARGGRYLPIHRVDAG